MIKDFLDLVQVINYSKDTGSIFYVLYKSFEERHRKLEEITDNLKLIYDFYFEVIDLEIVSLVEFFNRLSVSDEKTIFNIINIEKQINTNNEIFEILETKRETIGVKHSTILFWITQPELMLLSERAPNFFSFSLSNIYDIEDKSLFTQATIEEMIMSFEKKYNMSSLEFVEECKSEHLEESYEFNLWQFLLSIRSK